MEAGWRRCPYESLIHGIDTLQFNGSHQECLCSYCKTLARKIEVEDTAVAVVEI